MTDHNDETSECVSLYDDDMPPLEEIFSNATCDDQQSSSSLIDILKSLQKPLDESLKANLCNVDRADVIDGGIRCFKKKNFNPLARLNVKFAGEDGYDAGGLRREFMRLVLAAIRSYAIFDGAENARFLTVNALGNYMIKYFYILVQLL